MGATITRQQLEEFTRLTRDIYVPAGDVGFWQGVFRDPTASEFAPTAEAIEARTALTWTFSTATTRADSER